MSDLLPTLTFPIVFQMTGNYATYTGEVAGISVVNGLVTRPYSWRDTNRFTAGFGPVVHVRSGMMVTPINEGRAYRAEEASKRFNYYGEPPTGYDRMIAPDGSEILVPDAPPPGASATPPPPAAAGDFDLEEIEAAMSRKSLAPAPHPEPTPPPPAGETEESGRIPNPTPEQQAEAVKTVLREVLRAKGARFIRQVCENLKVQTAKAGEDMIANLVEAGMKIDEAHALAG